MGGACTLLIFRMGNPTIFAGNGVAIVTATAAAGQRDRCCQGEAKEKGFHFVPALPVSGFVFPLVDQLLSLVSSLVERSCPLTTVPSFFV